MWEIYDRLIAEIPGDITIDDCISGSNWTMVSSGDMCGIAITVKAQSRAGAGLGTVSGARLADVAELSKSWNFTEASIGVAAINAYYNTPEKAARLECVTGDAFVAFAEECAGKNVAVIGHFPNIEKQLAPICSLSVLERDPSRDDYPDSACEYILPSQDFVFITGMTFVNKTVTRLLQLCAGAKVALVGPSVPLSPVLFEYGADYLCGFCVTDPALAADHVKAGARSEIFGSGAMVDIKKRR
ncbi:MAG: DUF364 domain-containing protein [Oscillospiraceae bacterium]|jgi:uncharacterized protein (DUF4213/DUF364 family)|nr:DUF364 domain-containing protein [Oscillospiraceae bacterium]